MFPFLFSSRDPLHRPTSSHSLFISGLSLFQCKQSNNPINIYNGRRKDVFDPPIMTFRLLLRLRQGMPLLQQQLPSTIANHCSHAARDTIRVMELQLVGFSWTSKIEMDLWGRKELCVFVPIHWSVYSINERMRLVTGETGEVN